MAALANEHVFMISPHFAPEIVFITSSYPPNPTKLLCFFLVPLCTLVLVWVLFFSVMFARLSCKPENKGVSWKHNNSAPIVDGSVIFYNQK